ncbi:hypothetical protein BCR36DRAFT_581429 [Piromyces finnis]|uniref:Caprin-1 dimerization domain-containing protein n=1 Tax=Piromyces finnis TaxID=1754191 RepID=A0A1Y1VG58_9FUNG|nr:hypothetical protein BCR36DRAFT_581429 [Piromyces finnis]|eukprot:ORX55407.1 hypothetical protein BCR36DRAFT_581429 [Piromyces finnis]
MLSSRLNDSIRVAENKLSKKEKKRLAKIVNEEAEVESCAISDTNSEEKVNKYINIVNKKLRTLRKRMNKIEKYENCNDEELNTDQISAIKKKPEVSLLLKEFEDLHKQYTIFDEQEKREQEVNKKIQDERLLDEVNKKVELEKKMHSSQLQYLFKASYALNIEINTRKFTFSNAELNALNYVRNILLGTNEMMNKNEEKSEGELVLEKLYEASTDECCENVTFKDVNSIINLILNPPQVSKNVSHQNISFFSNDSIIEYNEQFQPQQQIDFSSNTYEEKQNDIVNDITVAMPKINFMQPNEVIDEENEKDKYEISENEIKIENSKELNDESFSKEISVIENEEINNTNDIVETETELMTEETETSVTEEKKLSEQSQNTSYQNNKNNHYQKKRGYYKGGRGRRNYQNSQYNNRHGNGNGNNYKNSRNNGYYPHQNQNYVSYYYNDRSATSF